MFSPLFNPLTQKPHKAYWSFIAFNELRKRGTAVRVAVTDGKGKDASSSFYATAARGTDGSVAVMLANAGIKEKPFVLDVGGGNAPCVRCRVIDEKRTWKEAPLPAALPPRSVLLVEYNP